MRRRAPISSRGFADLSQVGETKLLHDEVLYQLRIISSPKSSFPLRLSSCKELLSVVQSASKDAHLSVSLLSGVRDGLRANENEPVLVEALLSVLLVFMAREQFNGYTHASPILSLDLLRQVLVLAITLAPKNRLEHPLQESSEEQTSKPYRDEKGQEETKTGGRLKRKFSSSSASYSPEKIPTGLHQSPAVESAKRAIDLVTWPLVNESFIGCDKQYPSVFILASVFVNRFFMLAIERLNSLSSGAIQRSSNMDGDDDEVEGEDADILERSSTTSGGNKSMYSSESGTQDNVQPSIRNIEDAKQFLERAQTLLTATLPEASSTSPIGQSSYMEKMLILLGLHIKDLMRVLSKQKYNVDMRSQYSRVWLFLGILESSCFNFPSNQVSCTCVNFLLIASLFYLIYSLK